MRQATALRIPAPTDEYLGVTRSVTGRAWRARLADERAAYAMAQAHGVPELLARILAGRGIGIDDLPQTLAPSLRDQLCDPSTLRDMDRACERLAAAVMAQESVVVFGDYDVDGATASALLKRFIDAAGGSVSIYIPDRMREGYGPNAPALERLHREGARLVVTVDCGTQSFAPLAAARALGLDIIVVDHHQTGDALPETHALVNPNRLDDDSGQGTLAAVGVAFLLAVGTNRALRQAGWYARPGKTEPDLVSLLDLVALGTVADVVPLMGLNRVFVSRGLEVMARMGNVGLKALAEIARLDGRPTPYHVGFLLGPRVNAGGRVGEAGLGAALLTTADPVKARALAARLDVLNRERQAIEEVVETMAVEAIERGEGRLSDAGPLVVAGDGWHPGVVGIVASRLKERYGRPAIVIGVVEGVGKGSGRSIAGVDLGAAVRAAAEAGILQKGGGHAMAAGLTVAPDAVPALHAHLDARLAPAIAAAVANPALVLDGVLSGGASEALALIERAGPFGAGFPEPVFALAGARIVYADVVGSGHVAATLETAPGERLRAIAFRAADTDLGGALLGARGQAVHLAGRLKAGWRGRAPEFVVEDLAYPTG